MFATIILVSLALGWLLFETRGLTIRLQVGKDKPVDNKLRNTARTIAEWDIYNKEHETELEQERKEYEANQAYYKVHTCPICKNAGAAVIVETKTIVAGNSTCHVTGCPDCLEKYRKDIDKSQEDKIRQPLFKPSTSLLCDGYIEPICGNKWLKEHENFEYPEPTIEISINGKDLHVNGNYKKGLIGDFVSQYTTRVKAGKKTITVAKGGHVENQGGGVYIAINGEMVNGEYQYF